MFVNHGRKNLHKEYEIDDGRENVKGKIWDNVQDGNAPTAAERNPANFCIHANKGEKKRRCESTRIAAMWRRAEIQIHSRFILLRTRKIHIYGVGSYTDEYANFIVVERITRPVILVYRCSNMSAPEKRLELQKNTNFTGCTEGNRKLQHS